MTTLYIVRHGQAEGNIYRRCHGHYNGQLMPEGFKQLDRVAKRFASTPLDVVFSSDLDRAYQTAEAVCRYHPFKPIKNERLREIYMGDWEEIPWGDLKRDYPEQYQNWNEHLAAYDNGTGESFARASDRMFDEVSRLCRENDGKHIAVVSHAVAIRAFLCRAVYGGIEAAEQVGMGDNTAVTKLTYENGKFLLEFKNDNAHLGEISTFLRHPWGKSGGASNAMAFDVFQKNDIPEAVAFHKKAWEQVFGTLDDYDADVTARWIRRLSERDERNVVFPSLDGEHIGLIELDPNAKLMPSSGHISLFYLDEEYCNRGLGAQLVGYSVMHFRRMGKRYLTLRVAENNLRARRFYEKFDFIPLREEEDGDMTQIVMYKNISVNVHE